MTTALIRPDPKPSARRSLVCVGFCGGGTAPFRDWAPLLDDDTELVLVCYPGREGRFLEPACRTWDELAGDTTGVVRSVTDRPYVLFGHSMGGWMAFDVAVRLEREGSRVPDLLVVSSCNSPDRGVTDRDRYPCKENTDAELVAWMGDGGLLPEYVRGDDDLLEMAVDLMRADVRVRDTYAYTSGAGTSAPVHVLHGAGDALMDPGLAGEWPRVCLRPPRVTRLPGGHFYTPEIWRELPRWFSTTQGGTMARQRFDVTRRAGGPAFAEVPDVHGAGEACDWLTGHAAGVREALDRHGALFLRGLAIGGPDDFAAVRDVLLPQRAAYREKATPRSDFGNDVFSSTDLPPAQRIRQHNENSYTLTFPGMLLFGCLVAPESGGATPVADCREVLRALPAELVEKFRASGWKLIRNYGEHISLDWRTAFGTTSHEDVERYCEENLISCRWGPDDTLRTEQVRSAVIAHPGTGEEVWFNHAAFWNEWSLEPDVREVLTEEFGAGGLPFVTTFGDGEPISEQEAATLNAAYDNALRRETWQPGDLLIVDNILSTHGRESYRGARKIVVAMGQPVELADCAPTVAVAPVAAPVM